MKILIVNKHFHDLIGGSEIQCHIAASEFIRLGHKVAYAIVKPRQSYYDSLAYNCIPLLGLFIRSYFNALVRFKPDVVYWRHYKVHLLIGALLAKMIGARFVFGISCVEDTEPWYENSVVPFSIESFKRLSLTRRCRRLARIIKARIISAMNYLGFFFTDAIVSLRNDLMNKLPIQNQIKIYNSALLESKPFQYERPYIVWVSSLKPRKQPEKYAELASLCKDMELDFIMVGSIQHPHYEYFLNPAGLPENLCYLGPKLPEEVNGILKSSMFLVHTCIPEGFSNNFIQAWFQGKPVVSLCFDPDGVIVKHQIGFFSGSMEQFIKDVRRLYADENLRIQMGRRAKEFAMLKFDPEKNINKLLDLFKCVLNGKVV